MRLKEFTNKDSANYYSPEDDKWRRRRFDDTRKPTLTLKHLNKLRKMREAKKLDMLDREKKWQIMYGIDGQEDQMGPSGL